MTIQREPPRLRTLHPLPRELALALADSPDEQPTSGELAELRARLDRPRRNPSRAPHRPARGPLATVALTFALGAAAGVAGSSGVFFALREVAPEVAPRASASPSAVPRFMPLPARASEPATTPEPERHAPTLEPSPSPRAPASSATVNAPLAAATATTTGSREELELLARAQAALAANPATALSLANQHEQRFAGGALGQEREVVAIDALLRLGRRSEAIGRAVRFHQQFPSSVHGRRVDVLLGRSSFPDGDGDHK